MAMTRSGGPARPAAGDGPDTTILGRGWAFPVALDGAGDAALVADDDGVGRSIRVILGTAPGERVMRPDFGAGLNQLVFEPLNTTTVELVKTRVFEALERWEPRITVKDVAVDQANSARGFAAGASNSGLLLITIRYVIRASNTEGNLVYPFYLGEGAGP